MKTTTPRYLTHQLLIAMPHMDDPQFAQTLIYLIEHSPGGATGLIINRPSSVTLADILEQVRPQPEPSALSQHIGIHSGGPVQTERGFVLHPKCSSEYAATLQLGTLNLTSSQDVLFAIAEGEGPEHYLIALGYSGWNAGQLERELADNAWLTCPLEDEQLFDILFKQPDEQRLQSAAQRLGVTNLNLLSSQVGHA
ncbi:putative transcriptional regulator [Azomonas agilis]|uniref:UPF0301 protein LX59_01163 n=1 Tax=Azomonas agilis TaxID=116849 RepID=A0A562IZC4_9GAMM|nr:YqgE/AlgH family protein [Azomonas agilis]TWH76242.1 putative transcriptional regulator [Azomonas agilis]